MGPGKSIRLRRVAAESGRCLAGGAGSRRRSLCRPSMAGSPHSLARFGRDTRVASSCRFPTTSCSRGRTVGHRVAHPGAAVFERLSIDAASRARRSHARDADESTRFHAHFAANGSAGTVRVRTGQTLVGICTEQFGTCTAELLQQIHELNPSLKNPDHIEIGQDLRIPVLAAQSGGEQPRKSTSDRGTHE